MRAVPAADVEAFVGSEESALVTDLESAVIAFCIDDEQSGGSDHQMVDVAARAWDLTVMEDDDVGNALQGVGQFPLPVRAFCPRSG